MQKKKLDPYLTPYIKLAHVSRYKTIKLLEK